MGESPVLRVDGLTISLTKRTVKVVEDVSLSVDSGSIVGLVGESGSGKTTLALALLGHARRGLTIESGSICVGSTSVLGLSASGLRSFRSSLIAYVPQDPMTALNPALKVRTQIHEGYLESGLDENRVDEMVSEAVEGAGLGSWWPALGDRFPHQLSGGQQQRLVIAMAFARQPELIVLDEPTTGLDVTTQAGILETIRSLCSRRGIAALYVTHDLDVVSALTDRVCVMYSGRIVEEASTRTLFSAAVHPYSVKLLQASPQIDRSDLPAGIAGRPPLLGQRPAGCSFAPRCEISTAECRETVPPMELVGTDHWARCLRAQTSRALLDVSPERVGPTREQTAGADRSCLSVSNLSAGYGRHQVLRDISFDLHSGECLAVVGESGSGKTTLAQSIAGLRPWTRGTVSLSGRTLTPSIAGRSRDDARRLQYVFQNPYSSLNPRKTVGHLLEQPLRLLEPRQSSRSRKQRVEAVLAEVALGPQYLLSYPHQLSGGERQRVAIGRALISRPEFLICDEVTSSLDVSVQASIVALLDALRREKSLGLLFISHNLALIRSIAQRVMLVADGSIQESGLVGQVLSAPKSTYAIRLLEDIPRPRAHAGAGPPS